MHIGQVAERTGLSLRTLRHYDDVGLVRPSGRSGGGFRLYSEEDVDRLLVIRRMKPLGFPLERMGELLRAVDDLDRDPGDGDAASRFGEVVAEAAERRAELEKQIGIADEFLEILRKRLP